MKPKGWQGESNRHSLSARGVKTKPTPKFIGYREKQPLLKFAGKMKTVDDVKSFIVANFQAGINFHPDTPYEDYVMFDTKTRVFSDAEAKILNNILGKAFDITEKDKITDIYEISIDVDKSHGGEIK